LRGDWMIVAMTYRYRDFLAPNSVVVFCVGRIGVVVPRYVDYLSLGPIRQIWWYKDKDADVTNYI
jgi:hypothetical protein